MTSLGKRIKELRYQYNTTQKELAYILGYKSERSIQYIEADEHNLNQDQLVALANYYGVCVDYLVGRSNETGCDLLFCDEGPPLIFDVAKRLRDLRNKADMTIYRLSKETSIPDYFLRDFENGVRKNITVNLLSKICSVLGITLSEFFSEEKNNTDDVI